MERLPERQLVERFVEAVNRHDSAAVAAAVTPDAHISFAGLTPFEGRARVRAYFDWFAGYGARWDLELVTVEPGFVRCRLAAHDRWSEAAGISPLTYSRVDFTIDGHHIARVETEFTPQTNEALSSLLERFTPWATTHYPELYTGEGDYDYSFDSGIRMVEAMRQFQQLG